MSACLGIYRLGICRLGICCLEIGCLNLLGWQWLRSVPVARLARLVSEAARSLGEKGSYGGNPLDGRAFSSCRI